MFQLILIGIKEEIMSFYFVAIGDLIRKWLRIKYILALLVSTQNL